MHYSNGKILVSWSGGKDSAMALHEIRKAREFEVAGLLTALSESDGRVPQNKISREMIAMQADSIGLPVAFVYLPDRCNTANYREKFLDVLAPYKDLGVTHIAFGDLFLDDVRDFREGCFEKIALQCEFPLWQRCTKELALSFINAKFKAVITAVDCDSLQEDFLCRTFDRSFLSDIPVNVDPCGENGEFHTFVFAGPLFSVPLSIKSAATSRSGNAAYCDIVTKTSRTKKLAAAGMR
jgi:uncharacterized protein (TIGR00290 family)